MADKPKVKPSSAGIWIGILLMLVGVGGCAGGIGYSAFTVADKITSVSDDRKVDVPGEQSYDFKGTSSGFVVAYAATESELDQISVTLTGPNGLVKVEDTQLSASSSSTDTGAFRIIGAFSDQPSGKYTLASSGPKGGSVALVSANLGSLLATAAGGLLGGSLLAIIGFLLLVITAVRRSKAKKKFQAGGPPPGMGVAVGGYSPHGTGPGGIPAAAPGGMPPPAPGMAPPAAAPPGMPPFSAPPAPNYPPAPQGYPAAPPAAPAYEQPTYQQPAYQPPPEQYQPPAPTYEAPAPSFEAPAPAYEPPAPTFEAPAPAYEPPPPVYESPAPSSEAPAPEYEAPPAPDSNDYPPPPPPPGASST